MKKGRPRVHLLITPTQFSNITPLGFSRVSTEALNCHVLPEEFPMGLEAA